MTTVAIVGANGFVGKALCSAFLRKKDVRVVRVTRDNYDAARQDAYDILINSAMPSKRFWAKNNPGEDFKETVQKTEDLYKNWHYKKFIQISTVSARTEPGSVYGKHKAEAEKICRGKDSLIIRLSSMFSPDLSKGSLLDILNNRKVFVSGESRYPFVSVDFAASWISGHVDLSGTIEVGAKDTVSLKEIALRLKRKIEFEGDVENQAIENPRPEFPSAEEVFYFMEQQINGAKA